jgi:hypothetical protein
MFKALAPALSAKAGIANCHEGGQGEVAAFGATAADIANI